ncbi:MAG: methyltransferase [Acidiferrobacteraceae bacterium]|nr:methyltransferase [Acidiferrobacteraceae bacterium]|tara:strand:- start:3051 stop:3677 length:627 start_codon:yes stop_codon:yes gene_type:complete
MDNPNNLLARAYSLSSVTETLSLYEDWAASYDQHLEGELKYTAPITVASMFSDWQPKKNICVLDVGCGTGLVGAQLTEHKFDCIDGLDLSTDMLSQARKKEVYRDLFEIDLNHPFILQQSSYAGVVSCGTFTHGHVGADAFQRVLELLEIDGIFACTIHREIWLSAGFENLFQELCAAGRMVVEKVCSLPFFAGAPPDGYYCIVRRTA